MSTLPQFQSDDKDFQLMQNSWAAVLTPVIQKNEAIGRFLSVTQSSAVTLVTGVIKNVTSLSIPAGVWLLWGFATFPNLPANATRTGATLSTTSATQTGADYDGSTAGATDVPNVGGIVLNVGPIPIKLNQTTVYYLNALSTFSGTAPTVQGVMYAIQLGKF